MKPFAHTFTGDIDLEVSFYEGSLSGFGVRVVQASKNEFGSILFSTSFWKSLRRIGVNSSLNIWLNSSVKPSGAELFFVGSF